jgi:hypothetical protein
MRHHRPVYTPTRISYFTVFSTAIKITLMNCGMQLETYPIQLFLHIQVIGAGLSSRAV